MGVYIKNWSLTDWKELLMWAKIGANNAMIGEFAEVEEIQPHGRLIDADAFIATIRPLCEEDAFAACTFATVKQLMVEHINKAPTIIPEEEGETEEFDCVHNLWTDIAGEKICGAAFFVCKKEDCPMYQKAEEGET